MTTSDRNHLFPNQLSDGNFFECVALTVTDLAGNIVGRPFNPDFTYAATTFLAGATPGVDPDGADPWTGLQSAIAYGLLPAENAPFTAKTKGELFVSDWRNYSQDVRQIALQHQMVAPINLGKDYAGMVRWMQFNGQGVMLPLTWYSEFGVAPDGVIPPIGGASTKHCVAAYLDTDNTTVLIKPWLGSTWGRGGYGILTKELFDAIVTDVFSFDPKGSHWFAILAILLKKFPYLKDYFVALTLTNGDVDITHTDILYTDWSKPFPNAHHNVRALCDLTGVTAMPPIVIDGKTWNRKDIMTACVMIESGFHVDATNPNYLFHHDGTKYLASTDNGIAQWNNYYHGGEITPSQALHNPDMAIRLMCKYWLAGQERQWVSYTSGAFKKWLGRV